MWERGYGKERKTHKAETVHKSAFWSYYKLRKLGRLPDVTISSYWPGTIQAGVRHHSIGVRHHSGRSQTTVRQESGNIQQESGTIEVGVRHLSGRSQVPFR